MATASRATLNITGDASVSDLQIEEVSGSVRVTALNGTSLRIGGVDVVNGTTTFSGITTLNVRLGEGNDRVAIGGSLNLKNVSVDLGDGENTLDVATGLRVSSKLTINGGAGRDVVTLNGTVGKSASVNLGLGNDALTLRGTSFSSTASLNTGVGADVIDIDQLSPSVKASFNNSLTISTGEDDDTVNIRNATTKKVTINTGDDDDSVTLDTVTANGLLSVNTSAGADALNLLNVQGTVNGTNTLNVGTGADAVVISETTFQGNANIDLGTGIVNRLTIDDTDFRGTFNLTANGSVDGAFGDVINIDTGSAVGLEGTTTFRKAAKLKLGASAFVTLGGGSLNSNVDFLSSISFSGINPASRLEIYAGTTEFLGGDPLLNKVTRFNVT